MKTYYLFLFSALSIFLSSCYTVSNVTTASQPYYTSAPNVEGYSNLDAEIYRRPDCNDPYLKLKIRATENRTVVREYKRYGTVKTTKFFEVGTRVWGYGSIYTTLMGLIMVSSENQRFKKAGPPVLLGGLAGLGSFILYWPKIGKNKIGKKVEMGTVRKEESNNRRVLYNSSYLTLDINDKQRRIRTDNSGYLTANMREFGLKANHDYFNEPMRFEVTGPGLRDYGTIRNTLDKQKMIGCIYTNVILKYVKPSQVAEALNDIRDLVLGDECYSRLTFVAVVIGRLTPYISKENRNRIWGDAIEVGGCYLLP